MNGPDSANDLMEDDVYSPHQYHHPGEGESEVKQLNLNFKGSSSSNNTADNNLKNITTPNHFFQSDISN